MKRIVFARVNEAELWDVEKPEVEPGKVRIKLCCSAVSAGTERANLIGDNAIAAVRWAKVSGFPRVLGYSASGVIDAVGEGVEEFKVGDKVISRWGTHSEYIVVPKENVMKIPAGDIPMEEAAFVFITTFALAAVRKVRLEIGESCMVVGLGLLGLFSVQYAHLAGGYPVIAVDFNAERRALALKMGADFALDPADENFNEKVMELTGKGANTVIEVTGSGAALNQALLGTAEFGRVALLGCTRKPTEVDFYHDVHAMGIQLIGAHTRARPGVESRPGFWTERDDMRTALNFLAAGRLNIRDVVHEVHVPADCPEVYSRLASGDFPIGVVFDWRKL